MADQPPVDISTGELWRGIERIEKAVLGLKDEISKEIESTVSLRFQAQGERISRLENIVYGAAGISATALVTAFLGIILQKG